MANKYSYNYNPVEIDKGYLLVAGCSHAAGAEIDGKNLDSEFNRNNSFGNKLAEKMNRIPINIACNGATNSTILRSVMQWIEANNSVKDVFVLISWTESTRVEIPIEQQYTSDWEKVNNFSKFISPHNKHYVRLNLGWQGLNDWEKEIIERVRPVMVYHDLYMEINSANMALLLHLYLKSKNIKHLMVNSMFMFSEDFRLSPYLDQIDKKNYFNMLNNEESFYTKYKNLGFENLNNNKYWHHSEKAHLLYANELFQHVNTHIN